MRRGLVVLALLMCNLAFSAQAQDPLLLEWVNDSPPRTPNSDVDPYEGQLVISEREIFIPGNGGLDLVINRVYAHDKIGNTTKALIVEHEGWEFGIGWNMGFMPRIRQPFYSPKSVAELCKTLPYAPIEFEMPDGKTDTLYQRVGVANEAYSRSGWKFSCTAGSAFLFSPDGLRYDMGALSRDLYLDPPGTGEAILATDFYATKVTDPSGNWMAVSYGPYITFLRPASVTTSDGRFLNFVYNSRGQVAEISGPNGRVWRYEYKVLPAVTSPNVSYVPPVPLLTRVILPNGQIHAYDYYEPGDRPWANTQDEKASIYRIEGVTSPYGGVTTYTYIWSEAANHVYEDEFGGPPKAFYSRVSRKATSDGGTWTFSYAPSFTPNQYDVTTVAGPDSITVYKHIGRTYSLSTPGSPRQREPTFNATPLSCGLMDAKVALTGSLVEKQIDAYYVETNEWTEVRLDHLYKFVHRGRPLTASGVRPVGACQVGVFLPVLSKRTITVSGAAHVTEQLSHDQYGNPTAIRESGPNGAVRNTSLTYYHNDQLGIRNRADDEMIAGVGSIIRDWDALGRLVSVNAFGVATTSTYTAQGDVASVTRPGGKVTNYASYKRGIPQSESQPEAITVSRAVNDSGFITSETDGEGRTKRYTHDGMGRITSVDYPVGNDATITYTATSMTRTRGGLVELETYDGYGRITRGVAGGIGKTFTYDSLGRKTFESNPNDTVGTRYQYDAIDRIVRITNSDGTFKTFSYGAASVRMRDERANDTTYTFRAYGDPTNTFLMAISSPIAGASVSVTRGADDLVTSIAQAGIVRNFGYDSRKYLVSETNPESGMTSYERDAMGNMTARTLGGVRTQFSYDGQYRLTSVSYPSGTPNVTYTYTKTNKLRSVASAAATRSFSYSANDNVIGESLTVGSVLLSTRYSYDGNDRPSGIAYPISGNIVSYAPDVLGRPTRISGYANSIAYWPSGMPARIDYANGTVTEYYQNARLWTSGFFTRRLDTYHVASYYYYDGAGNLTQVSDGIDVSRNRTLGYDSINRLTSAGGPWGSTGIFEYDGAGNILRQSLGTFSLNYAYSPQNRLTSTSGSVAASYSYDSYGNIVAAGSAEFSYDAVPNLRCANCGGTDRVDYTYDGLGKRVSVTRAGVTTYEFYASNGDLLSEFTPSLANQLVEYIYLGGKRVAQRTSNPGSVMNPVIADQVTPLSPVRTSVAAVRGRGVVLSVNVGGLLPTGTVAFSTGGSLLGVTTVTDGRAIIEVLGLPLGTHRITATYSGDGSNPGNVIMFDLKVVNIDWLPVVLDIILSN